jgi:hypothetical protein
MALAGPAGGDPGVRVARTPKSSARRPRRCLRSRRTVSAGMQGRPAGKWPAGLQMLALVSARVTGRRASHAAAKGLPVDVRGGTTCIRAQGYDKEGIEEKLRSAARSGHQNQRH